MPVRMTVTLDSGEVVNVGLAVEGWLQGRREMSVSVTAPDRVVRVEIDAELVPDEQDVLGQQLRRRLEQLEYRAGEHPHRDEDAAYEHPKGGSNRAFGGKVRGCGHGRSRWVGEW